MNTNEYLSFFVSLLNDQYAEAITGLTDEQLYYLAYQKANHIAWQAWHFARTEDNIINFVCQNRKLPVWARQGLAEKWSLPRNAQGTGMTTEEAHAVRIPSVAALAQYIRDVNDDVAPYLKSASQEDLNTIVKVVPWGDATKLQHIGRTIIAHGNGHLGQIFTVRSIMGLQGDSF